MEIILKSEILYKSPEFHEIVRKKLTSCTDCITKSCSSSNLNPCVEVCMKPCIEFKLDYENKRNQLLDSVKNSMLNECLQSTNKKACQKKLISSHLERLSELFSSYT